VAADRKKNKEKNKQNDTTNTNNKKGHKDSIETFTEQAKEEEEFEQEEKEKGLIGFPVDDTGFEEGCGTPYAKKKFVMDLYGLVQETSEDGKKLPKKGSITIVTHPRWAPTGAQHFHDLVEMDFYKNTKFFRVVPDFVIQFGLSPDPQVQQAMEERVLGDDSVRHTNAYGTLSYAAAGPNSRTTQIFFNVNKEGNSFLDEKGFAPFAEVVDGFDVLERIYAGYGEKPDQGKIRKKGDEYLTQKFPNLTRIKRIREVEMESADEDE
jgi:cyclophilin family peptidyl-prolyl cis-trans isomerase